jgi:hypothetical protein
MKTKLLLITLFSVSHLTGFSQSLYIPNGLSGIDSSTTSNLGVGISNPSQKLHIHNGNLLISNGNQLIQSDLNSNSDYARFMFMSPDNYIIGYGPAHNEAHKISLKANNSLGTVAFWTNSLQRMLINKDGYIGVGTSTPQTIFNINTGTTGDAILRIEADTDNAGAENDNPRIEMYQDAGIVGVKLGFNEDTPTLNNHFQMDFVYNGVISENAITVNPQNGKVGFGVFATSEDARIVVDGKILAEEVKVQTVPASDYVFEPDYNLLPLYEVDAFIQQNKHLPNIPSAEEFKENGVGLGEMDDMLLRKVEEMTLYLLRMQKQMDQLMAENCNLRNEIENLKTTK